jgi:hypothetical protein
MRSIVPRFVVALGWTAGVLACVAGCSSGPYDAGRGRPFILAQPTITPVDPGTGPILPGCVCEPSFEVDVSVTDSSGKAVSGVAFQGGASLRAVCVGTGEDGATPDAQALDGDVEVEGDILDAGAADGGADGPRALDAAAPDAFVALDAADPDAAEAGTSACTRWRVDVLSQTNSETYIEVSAPGYETDAVPVASLSMTCWPCGTVQVVDRSVVLQPLPLCPADWRPCSADAGLHLAAPASCTCP